MRLHRALHPIILLAAPFMAVSADADEFTDFRIPAHRAVMGNMAFSGNLGHSGDNTPEQARSFRGAGGLLTTFLHGLQDSDPTRLVVDGNLGVTGNRLTFEEAASGIDPFGTAGGLFQTIAQDGTTKAATELAGLSIQYRRYPWSVPVGWELSAGGNVGFSQAWSDQFRDASTTLPLDMGVQRDVDAVQQDSHRHDVQAAGSFAVGAGRVRDATVVYEVDVLEHRLRESGAITRPLSVEARQRLASLLVLREGYLSPHEHPAKYLWRDLEKILSDDGALAPDGVGTLALLRSAESLLDPKIDPVWLTPRSPLLRETGWFAGPVVQAWYRGTGNRVSFSGRHQSALNDTLISDFSFSSEQHDAHDANAIYAGVQGEWHRPISMTWQADAGGQALFPVEQFDAGLEANTHVSIAAIVADRWSASAFGRYHRTYGQPDVSFTGVYQDFWAVDYGATFAFYLEDRVLLQISAAESQLTSHANGTGASERQFNRSGSVQLGLSYRFWGSLEAPGLIDPLRTGTGF
jgi:hypothetical protein